MDGKHIANLLLRYHTHNEVNETASEIFTKTATTFCALAHPRNLHAPGIFHDFSLVAKLRLRFFCGINKHRRLIITITVFISVR